MAPPESYYRWLAPFAASIEAWETTDLLRLTGADAVLSWVRGSALRPLLSALDERSAATFEAAYAKRLRTAYPPETDGITLFPFKRLYMVATRKR